MSEGQWFIAGEHPSDQFHVSFQEVDFPLRHAGKCRSCAAWAGSQTSQREPHFPWFRARVEGTCCAPCSPYCCCCTEKCAPWTARNPARSAWPSALRSPTQCGREQVSSVVSELCFLFTALCSASMITTSTPVCPGVSSQLTANS